MKMIPRLLSLLGVLALVSASVQAQAPADLAKEKAKLPAAVREIAEKGESAVKKATGAAKPSVSVRKAANSADPSQWGKQEVHRLAVMDVVFGGETQTVMFELLDESAPRHVANFVENCEAGAYKGLAIHRAIDGYLVQTGDPLTADDSKRNEWGTGGEDRTVAAEIKLPHKLGAVAMARRGDAVNPDRKSNGYQFYFALGNLSALDGKYSVFGQVVSGIEVLESMSRVPVDSNDAPLARIEVKSIRVIDQKGPLLVMRETGGAGKKRYTKPASARGPFERFLDRVW